MVVVLRSFRLVVLVFGVSVAQGADLSFDVSKCLSVNEIATILRVRNPDFSKIKSYKIAEGIWRESRHYEVDPAVVLSVIDVESSFRTDAVSPVGAVGLMQIMPRTAQWISGKLKIPYRGRQDLFDPLFNIRLGIFYLSYLQKKYRHNANRYLAAYNAGPGVVDRLIRVRKFRPRVTKPYIEKVKNRVPGFRAFASLVDPSELVMYELKIVQEFSAAHHIRGYEGNCARPHGHNWKLEVRVQTEKLNPIGIALDFRDLKAAVKEITRAWDHRDLNEIPPFNDVNPTAENVARVVFERLAPLVDREGGRLARVEIYENERSAAAYFI